jgi:hypothetical protein
MRASVTWWLWVLRMLGELALVFASTLMLALSLAAWASGGGHWGSRRWRERRSGPWLM